MTYQQTIFPQGVSVAGAGGGGGQPTIPTFYFNKSGSLYQAINASGVVISSNANADVVVNASIAAGGFNIILFFAPNTTFMLVSDIQYAGEYTVAGTQFTAPITGLLIIGGDASTILQQTGSNKNAITLSNGAKVCFKNFSILMPTASSGHGIFGADTGVVHESVMYSVMDNVSIKGCDSTHACMWLKNEMFNTYGKLILDGNNVGGGLVLDATDASLHVGNSVFQHIFATNIPSGRYALTIQALVSGCWYNLSKFYGLESTINGSAILVSVNNGGVVGYNNLFGLDLEASVQEVVMTNNAGSGSIVQNTFKGYMTVFSGTTAIDLSVPASGACHQNNIFDFVCALTSNSGTTVVVNDQTNGSESANRFNFDFGNNYATPLTASQFVLAPSYQVGQPKFTWYGQVATEAPMKNPNGGVSNQISTGSIGTIADGGTITHQVGLTPTWVHVEGDGAYPTDIVKEVVASRTATTFTVSIKTPAGVSGTAQIIQWSAGWHNY